MALFTTWTCWCKALNGTLRKTCRNCGKPRPKVIKGGKR